MRKRHLLQIIGGLLCSLVLTIILLEAGLRFLENQSSLIHLLVHSSAVPTDYAKIHTVEELLHSKRLLFTPGGSFAGFRLNSRGFRTPEYTIEKPDGVRRIVILGDSFASDSGGIPVDRLWHMQAGTMLERYTAQKIEMVNLGVPSVGPLFLERLFIVEGKKLDPDMVIVSFFVGNDLTDEWVGTGDRWEKVSYLVRFWRNGNKLWHSDAGMAQFVDQWRVFRAGGRKGGEQDPEYTYDPKKPTFSEKEYLGIERGRANIFLPHSRVHAEKLLAEVLGTLRRVSEEVRRAGAEPIVIVIPDEVQVNAALRRAVQEMDPPLEEQMDLLWINDAVRAGLEERGVPVLDLLPMLQQESRRRRLYKLQDTHWNREGNLFVAKELVAFISRHPVLLARIRE